MCYFIIGALALLAIGIFWLFKPRCVTDYEDTQNWIYFDIQKEKSYDVFFVHPTSYCGVSNGFNAKLDNEEVNELAKSLTQKMTGVFSESCNVFAPKYQQHSSSISSLPQNLQDGFLQNAEEDIKSAFTYYLENVNDGRAYIIAGHGQGTDILKNVLIQNPDLIDKDKLIAFYAIGSTITQNDIDAIGVALANTPISVPSIITYNTIGDGGVSPVMSENALCVNPINWTTNKQNQDRSKNSFAKITLKDKEELEVEHFTSAKIDDNGSLVVPTPEIKDRLDMSMGDEVYHIYDYDFFYGNLKENVKQRCLAWVNKTYLKSLQD